MRALGLPAEDYAVFGSAPLLAHGLITQIGDIDIVATRSAWRTAQGLGSPVPAPGGDRVVHLAPNLDIYNGWLGLNADAIIGHAELMDGLLVARLAGVAAYKHLLDRPQDRAHLRLIDARLARCCSV